MDMKGLLIKFYNASDSDALHKIVLDTGLDGPSNWRPYGGNQNNAGTFENQQSSPENALVEKITNSIDAILMLECYKRGIDPKNQGDSRVPRTMVEAIDSFYGLKNGKWENETTKRRNEIAQNIQVIVSSDRRTPNVAIYDNGEGQNPDSFEDTLLSMQRGNKNDIPFVQGKYNFGATGAVVFCGEDYRYQMIISRRHEDAGDSDGSIGFTLVRKHILSKEEERKYKLTWYEYLVIDGKIPRCTAESLDLGLSGGIPYRQGTVVKMYSYQLTHASIATFDLWRDLNPLLFEPALPILIYESRDFAGHSDTKQMLGNRTRIALDGRDNLVYQKSLQMSLFESDIPIVVYVFDQKTKNPEFIRQKSVIYTLNGQTQGAEPKSFISQDLGLRNLREYMLVSVDCTGITTTARQELFMASRDRLKQGKYYAALRSELIDLIKNDDDIKQWNQDYKGQIFKESSQDKDLIESLFSKLKGDKDIRRMLSGANGAFSFFKKKTPKTVPDANPPKEKRKKERVLKRYPTYFKIKGGKSEDDYFKAVSKGAKGRIKVETDVTNDFLSRSDDPGELEITILDYGDNGGHGPNPPTPASESQKLKVRVSGPYDGEMQFIIEPGETAEVGDIIPLSMKLISSAGEEEVIAFVKIEKEQNAPKKKQKEEEEPELSLPQLIRVFEKSADSNDATWVQCGMNAESVVKYRIGEQNAIEAILINVDSNLVKKLVNARGANVARVRDRYVTAMYSHALMLYTTMAGYYSQEGIEIDEGAVKQVQDNLDNALESAFQYYASFIMTFEDLSD